MNPFSTVILVVLCVLAFAGSRRWALLALLGSVMYLTQAQGIHGFGLNLFPTRVMEIVLLARVIRRREWSSLSFNGVDRAFVMLYAFTTVVFLLRSDEGQVFQVGVAVDSCLVYFCCRALITTPEDFRWVLRSFVLLLIPFTLIVAVERLRGQSPLAFMGWGAGGMIWMRDNGVRCFGSFRHPSLLGTLSVGFIPIFVGMVFNAEDRKRAVLGIILCAIIVWTTNSGGPISGVAFGVVAWLCWKVRMRMRSVRWGIVAFIAVAGVLMKAPVWYLIAHVSSITGGDGWHRSYLMDVSFQNLGQWWLWGMPMADTADWFPYNVEANSGGADITNEYIGFGIAAGLGAMALFILLLTRAFSILGKALHAVREAALPSANAEFFLWGLGCMLAAHIINWFGITYYDQTYVFWFAQLAAISTLSDWHINNLPEGVLKTQEGENVSEPLEDAELVQ